MLNSDIFLKISQSSTFAEKRKRRKRERKRERDEEREAASDEGLAVSRPEAEGRCERKHRKLAGKHTTPSA